MEKRPSFITMLFINSFTIGSGIPFAAMSIYFISDWTALRSEVFDPSSSTDRPALADKRKSLSPLTLTPEAQVSANGADNKRRWRPHMGKGFDWQVFAAGCLFGAILVAGTIAVVTWTKPYSALTPHERQMYDYCLSQGKTNTACDALIRVLRNQYGAE